MSGVPLTDLTDNPPAYRPKSLLGESCAEGRPAYSHCLHDVRQDTYRAGDTGETVTTRRCCWCGKQAVEIKTLRAVFGHGPYGPREWR